MTRYGDLNTAWMRVLYRLWTARRDNERFNLNQMSPEGAWISGGWVPNYAICSPLIGGSEGTRRARDLYLLHDIPVVNKPHYYDLFGKNKRADIYLLDCDPALIDFHQIVKERSEYRFPLHLIEATKAEIAPVALVTDPQEELFNNVIKENKNVVTQEWELD